MNSFNFVMVICIGEFVIFILLKENEINDTYPCVML